MTFTFERRLETFKRFNWPHGADKTGRLRYRAQPEDFAQAGFYCRPLAGSNDSVACFLCLKSLDGWESTDSAWAEHKSHSLTCPLVTLNLAASRRRTFEKWPGVQVSGGTGALVDAGFYHFPKSDGDDTCICYQCGLALDGWEATDDPKFEHARRRPKCPHVLGGRYIKPASFDFILDGRPDDAAIKEIDDARVLGSSTILADVEASSSASWVSTPKRQTPRKQTHSTIKASTHKSSTAIKATPLKATPSTARKTARKITISTSASVKKPQRNDLNQQFFALKSIFPSALKTNDASAILNWTVEEFIEHLIQEKLNSFNGLVRQQLRQSERK